MHVVQHVSKSLDLHWLTLGMAIMNCYMIEIWKLLDHYHVGGILEWERNNCQVAVCSLFCSLACFLTSSISL